MLNIFLFVLIIGKIPKGLQGNVMVQIFCETMEVYSTDSHVRRPCTGAGPGFSPARGQCHGGAIFSPTRGAKMRKRGACKVYTGACNPTCERGALVKCIGGTTI